MGTLCFKIEKVNQTDTLNAEQFINDIINSLSLRRSNLESLKTIIIGENFNKSTIPTNKFIDLASTFFFNSDCDKNKNEKFHKAIFHILTTSSHHLKDYDNFYCNRILFTLLSFTKNDVESKIKYLYILFPSVFEKNDVIVREVKSIFFAYSKFILNSITNSINLIMLHEGDKYNHLLSDVNKMFLITNDSNIVSFINYELPKEETIYKEKLYEILLKKNYLFDSILLRNVFMDIFLYKTVLIV